MAETCFSYAKEGMLCASESVAEGITCGVYLEDMRSH